jgi:hypothetical protein
MTRQLKVRPKPQRSRHPHPTGVVTGRFSVGGVAPQGALREHPIFTMPPKQRNPRRARTRAATRRQNPRSKRPPAQSAVRTIAAAMRAIRSEGTRKEAISRVKRGVRLFKARGGRSGVSYPTVTSAELKTGTAGSMQVQGAWPSTYIDQHPIPRRQGAKRDGMGVKFRVPFCRYGIAASGAAGSGALTLDGTNFCDALVIGAGTCLNKTSAAADYHEYYWLNQLMANMCQLYARFVYKKLAFRTVPLTATTSSARAYWACWQNDPLFANDNTITRANVMNSEDSTAFAAWQCTHIPAQLDDTKTMQYAQQTSADSTSSVPDALIRQMSPGAFAMVSEYANAVASAIYDGVVFIEGEIELHDPVGDYFSEDAPAPLRTISESCRFLRGGPNAVVRKMRDLNLIRPVTPIHLEPAIEVYALPSEHKQPSTAPAPLSARRQ